MQEIIERPEDNGRLPALVAAGNAVQQIRSAFATAVSVQKARNLPEVKRKLLEEARLMGEDAYYGWGAGKNAIEGPSIDLAVAAARCWGNCATDMLPVQDLPDCWIFTAAFIDLETGYTRTRQFRQSKGWAVHGKMDAERKEDIRFQIGQSKAERNVILKALPSWLINAALKAAKEGVRDELNKLIRDKGFAKVADRLFLALGKCGVKEEAILAKCGVAERKGLTVDHLIILRGDLNALQSGQERVEVLFPPTPAEAPGKDSVPSATPTPEKADGEQLARLAGLVRELGWEEGEFLALVARYGKQRPEDLKRGEAEELLTELLDQLRQRKE